MIIKADDGGESLIEYVVEVQDINEKGKFLPFGKVPAGTTQLVVKGLKDKGNYKFRVKAVNKEGESEALANDKHYQIKDPWDQPGKPGRPQITDSDSDRISLIWDPPMKVTLKLCFKKFFRMAGLLLKNTYWRLKIQSLKNGLKFLNLKVNKRVKKFLIFSILEPKATITGLKENQDYQFRIKAVVSLKLNFFKQVFRIKLVQVYQVNHATK